MVLAITAAHFSRAPLNREAWGCGKVWLLSHLCYLWWQPLCPCLFHLIKLNINMCCFICILIFRKNNYHCGKRIDVHLNIRLLEEVECFTYLRLHVAVNKGTEVKVKFRVSNEEKVCGGMKRVFRVFDSQDKWKTSSILASNHLQPLCCGHLLHVPWGMGGFQAQTFPQRLPLLHLF